MIVGIGVDVVDLARFERAVGRTPGLVDRLFAPAERGLPLRSLAGRFAAKEALLKALGATDGVRWHDMQVVSDAEGNPDLRVSGRAAQIAASRGIAHLHVSMSHDAGVATAFVIAESDNSDPADSDPADSDPADSDPADSDPAAGEAA